MGDREGKIMKKSIPRVMTLAAISLAIVAMLATSVFAVDVSSGQFYTEEEYQKLSGKEREAYCASLANEKDKQQSLLSEAQSKLDQERAELDDLKAQLRSVDSELEPLESEVSRLEREIAELEALPKEWTVRKG